MSIWSSRCLRAYTRRLPHLPAAPSACLYGAVGERKPASGEGVAVELRAACGSGEREGEKGGEGEGLLPDARLAVAVAGPAAAGERKTGGEIVAVALTDA